MNAVLKSVATWPLRQCEKALPNWMLWESAAVRRLAQKVSKLESLIRDLGSAHNLRESELREVALNKQVVEKMNEVDVWKQRVSQIELREAQLEAAIESLKMDISALNERMVGLSQENQARFEQIRAMQDQIRILEERLRQAEERIAELEQQLDIFGAGVPESVEELLSNTGRRLWGIVEMFWCFVTAPAKESGLQCKRM